MGKILFLGLLLTAKFGLGIYGQFETDRQRLAESTEQCRVCAKEAQIPKAALADETAEMSTRASCCFLHKAAQNTITNSLSCGLAILIFATLPMECIQTAPRQLPRLHIGADRIVESIPGRNLEYIVTNGIGGYAFSSVSGTSKRRYHGTLLAAPEATGTAGQRMHLLSNFEQRLCIGSEQLELRPTNFERFPVPTFCFEASGVVLGQKTCLLQY